MAYVSVTILENPEEIQWRIVNAQTQEQFYAYSLYKEQSTFLNFFNMEAGIWIFEMTRETPVADARVEMGTINFSNGQRELKSQLTFGSETTATNARTLFVLQ